MPQEIGQTVSKLKNVEENSYGDLKIFSGEIDQIKNSNAL